MIIECTKLSLEYALMTVAIAQHKRAVALASGMHLNSRGSMAVGKQIALVEYVKGLLPIALQSMSSAMPGPSLCHCCGGFNDRAGTSSCENGHNIVRVPGADWVQLVDFGVREGETRYLRWVRLTTKPNHGWISMVLHCHNGEEEPWYLVTDHPADWHTIRTCKLRMWVEKMCGDMKGNGLDLDTTHLRDLNRLACLMLGVCLVYVWLVTLGSRVVKRGSWRLSERNDRRDKSYFRTGWDWLEPRVSINASHPS